MLRFNQIFIFDMIGTLINDRGYIETNNIKSLMELEKSNISCIIATSLPMSSLTFVLNIIRWQAVVCADGIFIRTHGQLIKENFSNDLLFEKLPNIKHLLPILNINPSQVIYCGDSINDLATMQWINHHNGLSGAPSNSNDIIKNTACFVTTASNNQPWIAELIQKISKEQ